MALQYKQDPLEIFDLIQSLFALDEIKLYHFLVRGVPQLYQQYLDH